MLRRWIGKMGGKRCCAQISGLSRFFPFEVVTYFDMRGVYFLWKSMLIVLSDLTAEGEGSLSENLCGSLKSCRHVVAVYSELFAGLE